MRAVLRLGAALIAAALALTGCSAASGEEGEFRVAAIFSGPVTDADYNALGYHALDNLKQGDVSTSYSESVPVPDVERVLQEYVADGYDVIWTHGSQFYEATTKVAKQNPDVRFIGEFDGQPTNHPDNVWVIDRNFHTVFYPLGTLAANLTETGKIAYLGGLSLPFAYSEVHALGQAIKDAGEPVTLKPVFSGDFNDTIKAQQLTSQVLSDGNDVIVTSLNLGVIGAFNAINKTPSGSAWMTVKYTNKSKNGPDHYAAGALYDFKQPMNEIVGAIRSGTGKGYYAMNFGKGASIEMGDEIPREVATAVQKSIDGIMDGSVQVVLDQAETK